MTKESKPVLGWGCHSDEKALNHHAILSLGSDMTPVVTACRGRWGPRDPWAWFQGRDTIVFPKCGSCVTYVNAERAREGLAPITGIHPRYDENHVAVEHKFDLGGES